MTYRVLSKKRKHVSPDRWRRICKRNLIVFSQHATKRLQERDVEFVVSRIVNGDNLQIFKEERIYQNQNTSLMAYLVSYVCARKKKRVDAWFLYKQKYSELLCVTLVQCRPGGRGFLNSGYTKYTKQGRLYFLITFVLYVVLFFRHI